MTNTTIIMDEVLQAEKKREAFVNAYTFFFLQHWRRLLKEEHGREASLGMGSINHTLAKTMARALWDVRHLLCEEAPTKKD